MQVEAYDPRWMGIMLQCRAQRSGRRLPRPAGLGVGQYHLDARTNMEGVTMFRLRYKLPDRVVHIGWFESWTPLERSRQALKPLEMAGKEMTLETGGRVMIFEYPAGLPWPVPVEQLEG